MQILDGKIIRNEINQNSFGGTELITEKLVSELGEENLKDFQIIVSRLRDELRDDKYRIYYAHDLEGDDETFHLDHDGWKKFHKCVFVSHWQQQRFIEKYHIPWSRTAVLKNAIEPIEIDLDKKFSKPRNKLRFVYHTTPHRGLDLLVPVFNKLTEDHKDIHLDVFSSFKIYGWEQRDERYNHLFDSIKENKQMTYHGTVSNEEIKKYLTKCDVFVYPSIWLETSCIALIEAMSAGLFCIHPNLGALYETSSNWTFMYNYHEDPNAHANYLYYIMQQTIDILKQNDDAVNIKLKGQKSFADLYYSWNLRKIEWLQMLNNIKSMPMKLEEEPVFTLKT